MTGLSYALLFPIETMIGAERTVIDKVDLRRPTAGDMRATDAEPGEVGKALAMIGMLTGLLRVQVDKLDAADMNAIGDIIAGFTEPGRVTGATS